MTMIQDLLSVYRLAGERSARALKEAPLLILIPLVLKAMSSFLIYVLAMAGGGLGIFQGFLLYLGEGVILTITYTWYRDAILYRRSPKSLSVNSGDFQGVVSVMFIYYLGMMALQAFPLPEPSSMLVSIILLLALNPLGETVYYRGSTGLQAYGDTLEFMKENGIHFLLPFFLYIALTIAMFRFSPYRFPYPSPMTIPFSIDPRFLRVTGIEDGVLSFLHTILLGVYMIFRGHLYGILSGSSRRKRQYMGV